MMAEAKKVFDNLMEELDFQTLMASFLDPDSEDPQVRQEYEDIQDELRRIQMNIG